MSFVIAARSRGCGIYMKLFLWKNESKNEKTWIFEGTKGVPEGRGEWCTLIQFSTFELNVVCDHLIFFDGFIAGFEFSMKRIWYVLNLTKEYNRFFWRLIQKIPCFANTTCFRWNWGHKTMFLTCDWSKEELKCLAISFCPHYFRTYPWPHNMFRTCPGQFQLSQHGTVDYLIKSTLIAIVYVCWNPRVCNIFVDILYNDTIKIDNLIWCTKVKHLNIIFTTSFLFICISDDVHFNLSVE